jgi:anaerobic ribonucleoside-triphosphate reductase activating protein
MRVGIWFAGCPLHCPDCIAPDWQDPLNGRTTTVAQLTRDLLPWLSQADGVTISGGEPFAQPEALGHLLHTLRTAGVSDILVYSGYQLQDIQQHHPQLLHLLDALVDGPFRSEIPSEHPWRGSGNQKLHILCAANELRQRYELFKEYIPIRRQLQLIPRPGGATLIGIPRPMDIEELRNGIV